MSTTWIRVAYGIVVGLVLMFTIGFGVAMAIPGPKPPEDPDITFRQLTSGSDNESSQNRLTASVDKFFDDSQDFRDKFIGYQRNTFLVGAIVAAIIAAIALTLPVAVNYMRWGLLLGAALALVWVGYVATREVPNPAPTASSVLALLAVGEPKQLDFAGRFLRFAVSFVGLIVLVFVGLWRLTEWPATTRKTVAATPAASPPASPAPAVAAWAPPPSPPPPPSMAADTVAMPAPAPAAETPTNTATESAHVVTESPARTEPAPPEAAQWQRPGDGGEPVRRPDTTA